MFIANHLAGFGAAASGTGLTISTNTSEVDILTLATAVGYNNSVGGTITITINAGVTVSGSSTHAMKTGALHADTSLTIDNYGSINGYTGAAGSLGAAGSVGGDALYIETDTGGIGTLVVNNFSGASLQGGGGGGGGHGRRNTYHDDKLGQWCEAPAHNGSAGAAGGFGAAGASGSFGGGSSNCILNHPGAGGAAGYAMRKNGRTLTYNDSGTTNGTVG
jgi:hypothetical protein